MPYNNDKKIPVFSKEDFWNKITEKYPEVMTEFTAWIDKYKKDVGWGALFGNSFPGVEQIKYHHLPYDMQFGIFLKFMREICGDPFELANDLTTLEDLVKDEIALINAFIKKNRKHAKAKNQNS